MRREDAAQLQAPGGVLVRRCSSGAATASCARCGGGGRRLGQQLGGGGRRLLGQLGEVRREPAGEAARVAAAQQHQEAAERGVTLLGILVPHQLEEPLGDEGLELVLAQLGRSVREHRRHQREAGILELAHLGELGLCAPVELGGLLGDVVHANAHVDRTESVRQHLQEGPTCMLQLLVGEHLGGALYKLGGALDARVHAQIESYTANAMQVGQLRLAGERGGRVEQLARVHAVRRPHQQLGGGGPLRGHLLAKLHPQLRVGRPLGLTNAEEVGTQLDEGNTQFVAECIGAGVVMEAHHQRIADHQIEHALDQVPLTLVVGVKVLECLQKAIAARLLLHGQFVGTRINRTVHRKQFEELHDGGTQGTSTAQRCQRVEKRRVPRLGTWKLVPKTNQYVTLTSLWGFRFGFDIGRGKLGE
mmetsp:Transcript_5625/g.17257  ORF Transcript_5625/g.17257 Transcript_5625/m.17257 type:complete len:418 (-) Transcript_5625:257-1510(-)